MKKHKFHVSFILHVDKDNSHLSADASGYEEDVKDMLTQHLYEIDDVKVSDMEVELE